MTPVIPKQIQATVGSAAWWTTHLAALLAFATAAVTIIRPSWVHITATAQEWIAPVAMVLAVVCVIVWLIFALAHHKITRQTFLADAEGDLPGLRAATATLLPLVDQVPALHTAITAVSADVAAVKATLASTPAGKSVEQLVDSYLAGKGIVLASPTAAQPPPATPTTPLPVSVAVVPPPAGS